MNINDPIAFNNVKIFDGIPHHVQEVTNGCSISHGKESSTTFTDMFGRNVQMATNSDGRLFCAEGYNRAAWDMRCGNLRLSQDGKTLYRRDPDMSGNLEKLRTWHEVASLEGEYGVPRGVKQIRGWTTFIMNETERNPRVIHGMRFGNRAFTRENGKVVDRKIDENNDDAYEFCDPQILESQAILTSQAKHWCEWLTEDQHSAENLIRMFATPFLEPYKHLTYVLYGGGGNGKGIILGRMAAQYSNYASSFDTKRFAEGKGFTAEQESRKIVGKYWLFDEEADVLDPASMTQIKRLSTGDPVVARRIGENAMTFKPKATLIIATNNPFISTQAEASSRRFVFIRMKEGRSAADFSELLDFINKNGMQPFLRCSCYLWEHSDTPYMDVTIGGEDDMTDAEEWVRDRICADGYAISSDNPFTKRFLTSSRQKLGLRSSVRRVGNKVQRVLTVESENRFAPYREAYEKDLDSLEPAAQDGPVKIPEPLKGVTMGMVDPQTYGFRSTLAPAVAHGEDQKKSFVWNSYKDNSSNAEDRTKILDRSEAYAVVPAKGFIIVDMDRSKDGGESGWDIINRQVGAYGTTAFPTTYLVETPSGGVHAYYAIPKGYSGKIKNVAHPEGTPVDTRLERKGYAIGALSRTDSGEYQLCDIPAGKIPPLSAEMLAWFRSNDYFYPDKNTRQQPAAKIDAPEPQANPDMSPIPEGQRNQTLYNWTYGRLANHPGNKDNIRADLFERGKLSGLDEHELETIWGSVTRELG